MENLKTKVMNLLVLDYDYTIDGAQDAVDESVEDDTDSLWHPDASPETLAKLIAESDDS